MVDGLVNQLNSPSNAISFPFSSFKTPNDAEDAPPKVLHGYFRGLKQTVATDNCGRNLWVLDLCTIPVPKDDGGYKI